MKKIFSLVVAVLCASFAISAQDLGYTPDESGLCTIKGEVQVNGNLSIEKCHEVLARTYFNVFPDSQPVTSESGNDTVKLHTTYNFTFRPFPIAYSENVYYDIVFTYRGEGKYSYVIEFPSIQVISIGRDKRQSVDSMLRDYDAFCAQIKDVEADDTIAKADKKKQLRELQGKAEDISDLLTKSYKELMEHLETFARQL